MTALATLSACEGIGEGSTIKSLEIVPASGSTETTPSYKIYECLRDQLVVIATFTDGTRADFSFRATWTSEDPSIIQVSNGDIPSTFVSGGEFVPFETSPYRPGTLIPQAVSANPITITASFVGLSASLDVTVDTPTLKVSPVPNTTPLGTPPPSYVGENTTQRFAFLAQQGGKTVTSSGLNALGTLNPILWRFVENDVPDPSDGSTGDFDKFNVPSDTAVSANINALTGVVTGVAADTTPYNVEAVTSLCPTDPAFSPTAPVRISAFRATNPLTLEHEANFNGDGATPTGDFISGTAELLKVLANLDIEGDGSVIKQQDISTQVDFDISHTTPCTSGEANCVCDDQTTPVCTKNLFFISGLVNQLATTVNNDGADAAIEACFSTFDTVHTDDCDDDEAGAAVRSNPLSVHGVPVDLTGTAGSFEIKPVAVTQAAFTYPGAQFDAYGMNFAPLSPFTFTGGGVQKLTRFMSWTTRPQGSTTETSDIAFVRNSGDGFFNGIGQVSYLKDVTGDTALDVSITPFSPFASFTTLPGPVTLTVTP